MTIHNEPPERGTTPLAQPWYRRPRSWLWIALVIVIVLVAWWMLFGDDPQAVVPQS